MEWNEKVIVMSGDKKTGVESCEGVSNVVVIPHRDSQKEEICLPDFLEVLEDCSIEENEFQSPV